MQRKIRIGFLSQDCFAPCDIATLPSLKDRFDVRWAVFFLNYDRAGFSESEYRDLAKQWNIPAMVVKLRHRMRSVRTILDYVRIIKWLGQAKPDLVYVNSMGTPWLLPLVFLAFGRRKVIWAVHDVVDHDNKSRWSVDAIYKRSIARWSGACHLLSKNQKESFERLHPLRTSYYAPHPPRAFGPGTAQPPADKIRFFFFGAIQYYKGVDLLIEAAQQLWERGVRGFEVAIAGFCTDWETYGSRIRYPEIFNLDIRHIDNAQIPDAYLGSHYVVLPYRDVTQSGPLSSALVYHRPVIVSDLKGFDEFIRRGETATTFAVEDATDLAARMEEAVLGGQARWEVARDHVRKLSEGTFSEGACSDAYARMFDRHAAVLRNG